MYLFAFLDGQYFGDISYCLDDFSFLPDNLAHIFLVGCDRVVIEIIPHGLFVDVHIIRILYYLFYDEKNKILHFEMIFLTASVGFAPLDIHFSVSSLSKVSAEGVFPGL